MTEYMPVLAGIVIAVLVIMWRYRRPKRLWYWYWTPAGDK